MAPLLALALAAALGGGGSQEPSPPAAQPSPQPSPLPSPEQAAEPDLSISATVKWRSLRFDVVGTPRVELRGVEGVWEAERINLPRPVQPGVTYRDGEVRLRIHVSLAEMIHSALAEEQAPKVTRPPEPPR